MLFISYIWYGGSYPHPRGCELATDYLSSSSANVRSGRTRKRLWFTRTAIANKNTNVGRSGRPLFFNKLLYLAMGWLNQALKKD